MATLTVPTRVFSSGVFVSPAVTVTSTAQTATLQLVMPNSTERSDPSAHMDLTIDVSRDAGVTWKAYLMAGWRGGSGGTAKNSTVLNPPPSVTLGWPGANWAGTQVRISATLSRSMTIGATVTV